MIEFFLVDTEIDFIQQAFREYMRIYSHTNRSKHMVKFFLVTTLKATTVHATLSQALLACGAEPHLSSACGPTISFGDDCVSFDIIDGDSIATADVQDLARMAGVNPRENDDDGLSWPHAPTLSQAAAALATFKGA